MGTIQGRVKPFLLGVLSALLVTAIVGLLVLSSGIVSASALWDGGALDGVLAFASRRSIARHATDAANPFASDAAAVAEGLGHFKVNCLYCHGAPGLETAEFAKGLNPPPPSLTHAHVVEMSDGELSWVVSNGIRMTGMPAFSPTHSEEEIWKIVAFVRHLDELTDAERARLAEGYTDEAEHHHGGGDPSAGAPHPARGGQEAEAAGHDGKGMHGPDSGAPPGAGTRAGDPDGHDAGGHASTSPGDATPADVIRAQKPSYPLKACVISGEELGTRGDPIDHVVEGRLVRLCCEDCRRDVDSNPTAAFEKIDAAVIEEQGPGYPMSSDPVTGETLGEHAVDHVHGTRLVRFAQESSMALFLKDPKTYLAQVDKALIEAQRPGYPLNTCIVSGEALGGERGEPIDLLHGTRLVRLCCKECPPKFGADPTRYLPLLDAALLGKGK